MTATSKSSSAVRDGRALLYVLLAGSVVMSLALGARQTFGLFLGPFSAERAFPVTHFALAVAIQNLVWGLTQPIVGGIADRFGAGIVALFGTIAYGAGLALAAQVPTEWALLAGIGVFTGVAMSCTGFGVVLAAIGRAASPEQRSMAFGLGSAGGSVGQFLMVPTAQHLISSGGAEFALVALAFIFFVVAPLGLVLQKAPRSAEASARALTVSEALGEAARDRGYILLTMGFFTCGFQLAFIATHLPGYLTLCHMPPAAGAGALAVIGLFNIFGSWFCGFLGRHIAPQYCLGWLYLIRSTAIVLLLVAPKTDVFVYAFAVFMGVSWLGTVPLTSELIGRLLGVQHLGTLFGICFFSHQVGSFLGAWLGGYAFESTGSYDAVWILTAAAGVFAAALHFPIRKVPVAIAGQA
jgi:MFS family permease